MLALVATFSKKLHEAEDLAYLAEVQDVTLQGLCDLQYPLLAPHPPVER